MATLPADLTMYQAIKSRDESFIGVFVVAVKTTKIFCRPGCPARTPLLENVEFFDKASTALHAGYRPCKRCRPLELACRAPKWMTLLMEEIDKDPAQRRTDEWLREKHLDPTQVRRYFKRNFGMTFQAYGRACRMGVALEKVRRGDSVFTTGLELGFESDSGFRDAFARILGSSPKKTDSSSVLVCRWIDSPLGPMLAAANDSGLALLEFVDRRMLETQLKTLQQRLKCRFVPGTNDSLAKIDTELSLYFGGRLQEFKTPLLLKGTSFQERVWSELIRIPYGQVTSYLAIAEALGDRHAVRAVGKANGDNRLAIIVPCHRVIKADGSLCGYGGGLWRKRRLLDLESGQDSLI